MKEIDLYELRRALCARPGVKEAHVVDGYCPDDTIRIELEDGTAVLVGRQDGYPDTVLISVYSSAECGDNDLLVTLAYDFHNDDGYEKGAAWILSGTDDGYLDFIHHAGSWDEQNMDPDEYEARKGSLSHS